MHVDNVYILNENCMKFLFLVRLLNLRTLKSSFY